MFRLLPVTSFISLAGVQDLDELYNRLSIQFIGVKITPGDIVASSATYPYQLTLVTLPSLS